MLASVDELLAQPQPLSKDNIATLRDLHKQLQRKHELITPLDANILEAITEDDAVETEVLQAEETNTSISTAKAKISHHLSSIAARNTATAPRTPATDHHVDHKARVTRLPKLELSQFSGNPLTWQHFLGLF